MNEKKAPKLSSNNSYNDSNTSSDKKQQKKTSLGVRFGWGLCWFVTGFLILIVLARFLWHDGLWGLLLLNMFTTYLFLPAYLVVVIAAVRKRWLLTVVTATLVCLHLTWIIPSLLPKNAPETSNESIRVATANILMVHYEPDVLAKELEELDADILILQEFSSRWYETLRRRLFFNTYKYHHSVVREDSFGYAILSRLPITEIQTKEFLTAATIRIGGRPIRLLNVHTLPPRLSEYLPDHHKALGEILEIAKKLNTNGRSFIIAGDFNSTQYSRFAKEMSKYANDAWDLMGVGFGNTSPNGVFPFPPIRIDHIYLSKNLLVSNIFLSLGTGSDHKPIVADIISPNTP